MKTKFNLISKDGGRSIKSEEALTVIRAVGQNPSQREFKDALNQAKLNNKSTLTYDEFYTFAQIVWEEELAENVLNQAFKKIDTNGNGWIDTNEFRDIMMKSGEPLDQNEFDEIMRLADVNHDGKVTYSGNKTYLVYFRFAETNYCFFYFFKEFIRLFTQTFDND